MGNEFLWVIGTMTGILLGQALWVGMDARCRDLGGKTGPWYVRLGAST